MARFAIALLLLAAGQPDKSDLVLRASPRMGMAEPHGRGWCLPVLLTAEINGPETPELYCPRVEWTWPNGTTSTVESDCPPFEARDSCLEPQTGCGLRGFHRLPDGTVVEDRKECPCTVIGYPRLWTQWVCLPKVVEGENRWTVEVRLTKGKKTLRKADVEVTVH